MNTLVSIIIPTYNHAKLIGETLDSVLFQTYINWECIIVDDGSMDETLAVLDTYKLKDQRIKIFKRPKVRTKGANACRNIGFKNSHGKYVMFLDADDILSENCLKNRVNEFYKNDALDFIIANTAFYNDGVFYNKPICTYPEDYTVDQYLNLFLTYEVPWTIMSVLWKRETIINVRFDEALPRLQDVDFHIQVLLQDQLDCIRLSNIDTYYRSNTGSKKNSKHYKNVIIASRLFFEKYITESYLNFNQKKKLRRFIMLFLFKYVYPFQKEFKVEVKQIDVLINNSKLFSIKELFLLKTYKLIIKLNLNTKTGLGIYRFTKALKKGLNYDK